MNKSELIKKVAERTSEPRSMAERMIHAIFDLVIPETLAEGEKITIPEFGVFEPVTRAARNGRNPATGETLKIEERMSVKFKPAKALKELVN